MKKFLPLIIVLILFTSAIYAQKYSNEFLSIGVSAEAQALGNSVVATVDDVTSSYWNPAGLAGFHEEAGLQLGAMHSEWFAGIGKFDYLGMTIPMAKNKRRIAISLIRFGIDNIPNTLSLYEDDGSINYDNIVEFSAADYALFTSYGQKINIKNGILQVGGSFKIVRRIIGKFANSWGFGLDIGVQYSIGQWNFGLVGKDVTNTFNAWRINFTDKEKDVLIATGNDLPDIKSLELTKPQILLGFARHFDMGKVILTPEFDFTITTDGKRNTLVSSDPFSLDPSFGLELDYDDFVFLRAGVNQFQQESSYEKDSYPTMRPSIGVGLKFSKLKIDYAFTDPGDSRKTFSHIISLTFDMKPKKKRGSAIDFKL